MRFHHLLGGFVLSFAAAGLGALAASPILTQFARPNDAQAAWEIGLLFFVPMAPPALFTLYAIARSSQARKLRDAVERQAHVLTARHGELTKPNRYGLVETTRWSDEVWQFRKSLPDKLPLLSHSAALRIATEHLVAHSAAAAPAHAPMQPVFARFIGAELIRLGWRAKLLTGKTQDDVHILAEKHKVRAVVLCSPGGRVGNALVQRAAKARAHTGADIAAVVAQGEFDKAARALGLHTRVGLLHTSQIAQIHRAAGKVWRRKRARLPDRKPAAANAAR